MQRRASVSVGAALLLAAVVAMFGSQLFFRQSTDLHIEVRTLTDSHIQCSTATNCMVTLVSGAETTNTHNWSITSDNDSVAISPASGSIRLGTSVSIAVTLPAAVCPIYLSGLYKNGNTQVGSWSAWVTDRDAMGQKCENFFLTHPT